MIFNFFEILSKDDKELIHSSFIQFLLKDEATSNFVLSSLFPHFNSELNPQSIILEKVYSYSIFDENGKKKNKRLRLDIEGESVDGQTIFVLENKFKSFPYADQLQLYDERLKAEHGNKGIVKYLLCFDTSIIPFDRGDWHFISYNDVLQVLMEIIDRIELEHDKTTFIEHYIQFLSGYFDKYEEIKKSCGHLFFDARNDANKFWLRHVNAIVRLKLEEYFSRRNINVRFNVNPGNTSTPLLNLYPQHWNREDRVNILIQVQDDNLKYYYHSNDHNELNQLIESAQKGIEKPSGRFNRLSPNRGKTNFIYQEKLDKSIINEIFTVDDFANRIISFYEKVDKVASKRFENL